MGVYVLYSNNTTELIGSTLSNGDSTIFIGGVQCYGTRTETWAINSITVGGTPIFP
jgi:hypothetical protein